MSPWLRELQEAELVGKVPHMLNTTHAYALTPGVTSSFAGIMAEVALVFLEIDRNN